MATKKNKKEEIKKVETLETLPVEDELYSDEDSFGEDQEDLFDEGELNPVIEEEVKKETKKEVIEDILYTRLKNLNRKEYKIDSYLLTPEEVDDAVEKGYLHPINDYRYVINIW